MPVTTGSLLVYGMRVGWAKAAVAWQRPSADNCSPPYCVASQVEFDGDIKPGFQGQKVPLLSDLHRGSCRGMDGTASGGQEARHSFYT